MLFINDLHLYIEQCDSDYYADDAAVHTSGKTKYGVEAKLQHDGNKTKQWGKQNKMNMHYEKTSCMLIGTRHSTQHSQELDIYIDGDKIKNVTKQKLLGIYIDENLQWSDYIDYLCSTTSSKSLFSNNCLYIFQSRHKSFITKVTSFPSLTTGPALGARLLKQAKKEFQNYRKERHELFLMQTMIPLLLKCSIH